jgi:hypothetical protein
MDQETFNKIKEQAMKEVIEKFYPNAEPTQKLAIQQFLEQFLNTFRPHILPEPYKRVDQSYTDLIMSLIINGSS